MLVLPFLHTGTESRQFYSIGSESFGDFLVQGELLRVTIDARVKVGRFEDEFKKLVDERQLGN